MARKCVRMMIGVVFILVTWGAAPVPASAELFPLYDCIQPNVSFWKDIYSKYSTFQGVLHDRRNLSIVYGVVELVGEKQAGSREINRKIINEARENYERILQKLASGQLPGNPEERRVAALFGPNAGPGNFQTAAEQVRFQLGQSDRFREGIIRSGAYLDEMKLILRNYGLPEDLAYIPHVESSFNYRAYSRFGAAGLWQFMRDTGKQYMIVDYVVDERRDPIRATHAAAQYLQQSYGNLQCWPSAVTSYNYGPAGMRRAQQALSSYERIFQEYNEGRFGFASRNFYPEFLAAREVAKNYRTYFGELKLAPPLRTSEIKLSGYMPIAEVARRLSLNVETLQELNPGLREPVFTGQKYIPKGYTLRIPERNLQQLNTLVALLDRDLASPAQRRSQFYRVQRGDTASGISRAQRIELSELIAANQLDRRATIYVGQNLRIPANYEVVTLAASKLKRPVAVFPPPKPAPKPVQVAMLSAPRVVVTDLAPPEPLLQIEEPSKTLVHAVNPAVVTGNFSVEMVSEKQGRFQGSIRVEAEETLSHFAEWLKVPAQTIRELNGIAYSQPLRIHQRIKIPLEKVSRVLFEERRYEYHKEIEEDFFAAYRAEGVRTYRIKRGDSIWSLCRNEFEVPFWLLLKYNETVDFNNLRPAQEIMVPIVEKINKG